MPDNSANGAQPGVASLVGGIIEDTQTLIRQEVALARRELQDEWTKAKAAAAMLGIAAVVCGLALLLLSFCIVNALEFVLPAWACFLIVGGAYAILGGFLMVAGINKINEIRLVPQTTDSVRQDVRAVASAVSQPSPYVRR